MNLRHVIVFLISLLFVVNASAQSEKELKEKRKDAQQK